MATTIEVQHLPVTQGRGSLRNTRWDEMGIPSISPTLTTRWQAQYKEKFLDPGENQKYLIEILEYIQTLQGITTQRAIYYALRGRHPDWKYKGAPLGDDFYNHLVMWLMEKAQLMTGMTMQSMGVWAAPRGYITGDGTISTATRGRAPLNAKPALGFDMADIGMVLSTNAKKVIHFEKDAGLDSLVSDNFPRYIEALFSTSQGQLTEAANKFLRECEDRGLSLYSVHDGDPSGIQMQLLYGMATKNNCYMPSEFYPKLVKPLGFYPSIGEALGLPPEEVTDKEDRIFDNLLDLVEGKQRTYPELRRFGFAQEVGVIIEERKKWEFQALNAIHESAPKIYLLEGLRIHGDEIKHVPPAQTIKDSAIASARQSANQEVDRSIASLADSLLESAVSQVVDALEAALSEQISQYNAQVSAALEQLSGIPASQYREFVKRQLVGHPEKYASQLISNLGATLLHATFTPKATLNLTYTMEDVSATSNIEAFQPGDPDGPYTTKTMLTDAIEKKIISNTRIRTRVVSLIRDALEARFGEANDQW